MKPVSMRPRRDGVRRGWPSRLLLGAALLLGGSVLLAGAGAWGQAAAFRRIAAAGHAAPGGGIFDRFDVEQQPVLAPVNAAGQVAFFAALGRSTAEEGIYLAGPAGTVRLAAQGDRAPGGGVFAGFAGHPLLALDAAGAVLFTATLAEAGTTEGVFLARAGRIEAVARAGDKAPGFSSGTLSQFDLPALNDAGTGLFVATVRQGRESREGIFRLREGRIEKVVAQGDPAPGGGSFTGFGVPALNNSGAVVFPAVVEQGAAVGGIYRITPQGAVLVLGAGDPAPGGGIFYKFSERIALDDDGRVALVALLRDGAAPAALVLVEARGPRLLARLGAAAPGGGTFASFGPWPAISPAGTVAFAAGLDQGSSGSAIFLSDSRGLRRLVGQGDRLGSGEVFAALPLFPVVSVNSRGAVTFVTVAAEGRGQTGIAYYGP
jgi:hypothetical protein